jgi:hypothetical protein
LQQRSFQSLRYTIGDAQRVRYDGESRVNRSDRRKEARVGEIKIIQLVRLAIEIEHRCSGIGTEASSARLMCGATERDVLAEIKRSLLQNCVMAGGVQNLLELALQMGERARIGCDQIEVYLAVLVVNAVVGMRQIFGLKPEIH